MLSFYLHLLMLGEPHLLDITDEPLVFDGPQRPADCIFEMPTRLSEHVSLCIGGFK